MKIDIIGSVASGKTTLATELSQIYKIPFYEKDNIVWNRTESGDMKRSDRERDEIFRDILKKKDWIVEGSPRKNLRESFICCASNELKIYFMTSKAYAKYKQIIKNPLVAMCFNNVQIQGRVIILGHPSSDENKEILERCEHLDKEFMYWAKYKNTVLIEVDITEVECWNNNGREYIDVLNKKSYRIG